MKYLLFTGIASAVFFVASTAQAGRARQAFQGPDRITQDEQYLWQPSLDPVRMAGALKKESP